MISVELIVAIIALIAVVVAVFTFGMRMGRLEKDVSETDSYGRFLRYVWVGDIFAGQQQPLGAVFLRKFPQEEVGGGILPIHHGHDYETGLTLAHWQASSS